MFFFPECTHPLPKKELHAKFRLNEGSDKPIVRDIIRTYSLSHRCIGMGSHSRFAFWKLFVVSFKYSCGRMRTVIYK